MLETREYKIRQSNNYSIPSKRLVKSWTLKPKDRAQHDLLCEHPPRIKIKDLDIYFNWQNTRDDPLHYSLADLRNYARNIQCPETEEEEQIVELDRIFFAEQIDANEYYKNISSKDFFESVFTMKMNLNFEFQSEDIANKVGTVIVEEVYYANNA